MSTMEQKLLQDMIHERDARIAKIMRQVERHDEHIDKVQKDVIDVKQTLVKDSQLNKQELIELQKTRDFRRHEMLQMENQFKKLQQGGGTLHVYAETMKVANQDQVTSSYVTRAQAQLCRAMHTMGALEHQVVLVEDKCSKLVKALKEQVAAVVEEKTKVELQVMNELVVLDDEKRSLEEKLKEQAEEAIRVKERFKLEAGIDSEASDDEQQEEELDEEEEELKEMIEEGREEIKRLEAENARQLETIQRLKKQIEALEQRKAEAEGSSQSSENVDKEQPVENGGDESALAEEQVVDEDESGTTQEVAADDGISTQESPEIEKEDDPVPNDDDSSEDHRPQLEKEEKTDAGSEQ